MPPSPGFATRPEIEEAEKGFVAWLEANGAALCGVRITRFADGSGRGVAAARNLDAGEVVVKVPESLVLTPESSRAADAFREFGLGPEEFDSGRLEREALVGTCIVSCFLSRGARQLSHPLLSPVERSSRSWQSRQVERDRDGGSISQPCLRPNTSTAPCSGTTRSWKCSRGHPSSRT